MTNWLVQFADIFGASRYAAHSICLSNDPVAINLYVIADFIIFASYMTIGGILVANHANVARFIRFIYFDNISLVLFGGFILLCALTHFTMILTLYFGVYYLDLFMRCCTAAVSAGTAWRTAVAFYVEHRTPNLVESLGVESAEYAPRPIPVPNPAVKAMEQRDRAN